MRPDTITVHCLQLDYPAGEGAGTRLERILGELRDAPAADLVVLPELWDVRYFDFDSYMELARPIADGPLPRVAEVAAKRGSVIAAGSILERDGPYIFNTVGLLGEDGELLGRYRKMHLFPYGSREAELLTPGEAAAVIHTRLGRIGLATCFDLRFPEQFAEMRELGADLFVVPAAWPAGRVGDWEILIRARAMENQLPLVGCNGVGDCAGVELGGSSLVVDGRGRPLAAASKDPSSLSAVIDHEATARWRRDFPMRARPAALPA